jgi:hypothetical protein
MNRSRKKPHIKNPIMNEKQSIKTLKGNLIKLNFSQKDQSTEPFSE